MSVNMNSMNMNTFNNHQSNLSGTNISENSTNETDMFDQISNGLLLDFEKEKEQDLPLDLEAPEGGMRAYLVACSAATIMAMSFGMCNSYGVYQSYYELKYPHVSSNVLSIIGSLQAALTFLMALPSTILMNYIGPQAVVLIGGLLSILGFMFLSITNEIWQIFITQGLMFGMGSGIMYVHSTGVTFQYFEKKKALAQGVITGGASLAGVYWPIGVNKLIEKVGFDWTNRIIGFIYIPMLCFAVTFLKPRLKPKPRQPGENFLRVKFSVLKNGRFLIVCLGWFLFMLCLFPGMFYIDLFCIRLGVNTNFQQYSVAIINACAFFFRIFPGLIADNIGRINMTLPCLLFAGIFPLALWIPANNTATTVAFVVLWSCFTGAPVALYPTIVGQLFKGPDMYSYLSFFFVVSGVSSLIGPIIAGTFIPAGDIGNTDGFDKLAIWCGVLALGSLVCLLYIRFISFHGWFIKV
ncbi:hypothetical protein DAMA08_022300 [Martiniozyma asiatica (nom. inval.)]|nr:hypothetical protein DAMA08_022300 [Martiniozyma asiatica]